MNTTSLEPCADEDHPPMTSAVTLDESRRLIALEKTIESGRKTFVEVGLALAEIRDSRLYRADFDTFEAYCQKKWGWKRDYCDKLISGANVVKQLPEKLHTIVGTETQARELAKAGHCRPWHKPSRCD